MQSPGFGFIIIVLAVAMGMFGRLVGYGSRRSVAVERGLLIMLLGTPLAVAGAIIGLSS